jgi:predicted metal-binding membrane protein
MRLRRWHWRHPEAAVLALSALAWVLLFVPVGLVGSGGMSGMSMQLAGSPAIQMGPNVESMRGMAARRMLHGAGNQPQLAMLPRFLRMTGVPDPIPTTPSTATGRTMRWTLGMFVLMAIAMMLPSTTESARLVAALSMWRRRYLAIAEWLVAFVVLWAFAGTLILGLRELAIHNGLLHPGSLAMTVGLVLAAAWQLTPAKQLALNGCHGTRPLSPRGARADGDCLLYGVMIGRHCVISCGPMMAAMTLGDRNQLIVMLGMTAVVAAERVRHRRPRRMSAVALGLLSAATL